jgi:hypothetical protein
MSDSKLFGKYTPESVLSDADAELGPACCDEDYQRLRAIMVEAPNLLEALEHLLLYSNQGTLHPVAAHNARKSIARARGLSQ